MADSSRRRSFLKYRAWFKSFGLCLFVSSLASALYFRDVIATKQLGAIHDTLKTYPIFHYFIQNLQNGVYPLWSPHTHNGEPFWTYLGVTGQLNPVVSIVAAAASIFRIQNINTLFHQYLFGCLLVFGFGMSLWVRELLKEKNLLHLQWLVIPATFFGTFSSFVWSQIFGTIIAGLYFPLVTWLIYRGWKKILRGARLDFLHIAMFSLLVSAQINMGNSAFFVFAVALWVALFLAFSVLWKESTHWSNLRRHGTRLAFSVFLIVTTSLPSLYLLVNQKEFYPIGRGIATSKDASYGAGLTAVESKFEGNIGTEGRICDLVQPVNFGKFCMPLELPLVMGIPLFFLALIGFFSVMGPFQLSLIGFASILAILIQGADYKLSLFLHNHVPFFTLMRHMQFLLIFVYWAAVLLATLGIIKIWASLKIEARKAHHALLILVFIAGIIGGGGFLDFQRSMHREPQLLPLAEFMRTKFKYEGQTFQKQREFKLLPFSEANRSRDLAKSFGEPFFLYKDSVRFYDHFSEFLMPFKLWKFLNSEPDVSRLYPMLGIGRDKLQLKTESAQSRIEVIEFSPNHLALKLDSSVPNALFYSQNNMAGWKVLVNGESSPTTSSAHHPFFEIPVQSGASKVSFVYRPNLLIASLFVMYAGQVFLFIALAFLMVRQIKRLWKSNVET